MAVSSNRVDAEPSLVKTVLGGDLFVDQLWMAVPLLTVIVISAGLILTRPASDSASPGGGPKTVGTVDVDLTSQQAMR